MVGGSAYEPLLCERGPNGWHPRLPAISTDEEISFRQIRAWAYVPQQDSKPGHSPIFELSVSEYNRSRKPDCSLAKGENSMSTPLITEKRDELDELHRAIEAKGIRIAIFMLGYWGALLFGADKAAELWPQYFAKAPFWAAVVAFSGFAWNCYRDYGDWRLLSLLEETRLSSLEKTRLEKELDT